MKVLVIKEGDGDYSFYGESVQAIHLVPDEFDYGELTATYQLYYDYFTKITDEFKKDPNNCLKKGQRLKDTVTKELETTFSFSNFLNDELGYKKIEFLEAD